MSLGLEIKVARTRRGMKAKELAKQVEIEPKYLSLIENDKARGLSVQVSRRICIALGVSSDQLLELPESDTHPETAQGRQDGVSKAG